jgi:multiple sugar transport system substrate-binding protein
VKFIILKQRGENMRRLLLLLTSAALLLSACGAPAVPPTPTSPPATETSAPTATITPTETPAPTATITPTPTATLPPLADTTVEIHWFVGLGTGTDSIQVAVEKQVVKEFNDAHPHIKLILDVVPFDGAQAKLASKIAAGEGPDIVGPVGWAGANHTKASWFNLNALIEDSKYDLSDFNSTVLKSYQTEEGQIALPIAIFPGAVYYQKKLFDEAGLAYPPAGYGEKYKMPDGSEVEWSWETLTQVARLLTKDINGKNATEDGFDVSQIVQYGYVPQWQSPAHVGAYWGAGRLYDANKNAVIPDNFKAAWEWYHDGIWGEKPFIPNFQASQTLLLRNGNSFDGGHVGMAVTQSWYTCCTGEAGSHWDLAALPSYNGQVHGRVDTDTFRILKQTAHPREAFEVLTYLSGAGAKKLIDVYGGMPARISLQDDFLGTLAKKYPFVTNWTVFKASINYIDIPSSEDYSTEVIERLQTFDEAMTHDTDLDISAAIEELRSDLDVLFKQ